MVIEDKIIDTKKLFTFLRNLLILCTLSLTSCTNDVDLNNKVNVIDPESIIGKAPIGVPRYDDEQLIMISGLKDKLRYGGTLGIIVSSSKESEVYENVLYLKEKAQIIFNSSTENLNNNFTKFSYFDEILTGWYYLNKLSLTDIGIVISCDESFGQTEQQRKDDSSCFIRGKIHDYYFSYTIYHDEYLKYGVEIHNVVVEQLTKLK